MEETEKPSAHKPPLKIENNTGAWITLPDTQSFPEGMRIPPLTVHPVPQLYWDELGEMQADVCDSKGQPRKHKDGTPVMRRIRDRIVEEYTKVVKHKVILGANEVRLCVGPRLTIYEGEQARNKAEGTAPPDSLERWDDEEQALKLVETFDDLDALKRWGDAKTGDRRPKVRQAAMERYKALRGGRG